LFFTEQCSIFAEHITNIITKVIKKVYEKNKKQKKLSTFLTEMRIAERIQVDNSVYSINNVRATACRLKKKYDIEFTITEENSKAVVTRIR
jgi:hypothetical protein